MTLSRGPFGRGFETSAALAACAPLSKRELLVLTVSKRCPGSRTDAKVWAASVILIVHSLSITALASNAAGVGSISSGTLPFVVGGLPAEVLPEVEVLGESGI